MSSQAKQRLYRTIKTADGSKGAELFPYPLFAIVVCRSDGSEELVKSFLRPVEAMRYVGGFNAAQAQFGMLAEARRMDLSGVRITAELATHAHVVAESQSFDCNGRSGIPTSNNAKKRRLKEAVARHTKGLNVVESARFAAGFEVGWRDGVTAGAEPRAEAYETGRQAFLDGSLRVCVDPINKQFEQDWLAGWDAARAESFAAGRKAFQEGRPREATESIDTRYHEAAWLAGWDAAEAEAEPITKLEPQAAVTIAGRPPFVTEMIEALAKQEDAALYIGPTNAAGEQSIDICTAGVDLADDDPVDTLRETDHLSVASRCVDPNEPEAPATIYVRYVKTRDLFGNEVEMPADANGENRSGEYRPTPFVPLDNAERFIVFATSFTPEHSIGEMIGFLRPDFDDRQRDVTDYRRRLEAMPPPTSFVEPSPFRVIFAGDDHQRATVAVTSRDEAFRIAAEVNANVIRSGTPYRGPHQNWATVYELGTPFPATFFGSLDSGDVGTAFFDRSYPMRFVRPTAEELARYPIDPTEVDAGLQPLEA